MWLEKKGLQSSACVVGTREVYMNALDNSSWEDLYAKEPLGFHEGIPLFSEVNSYIANYEQISADHLAAYRRNGTNPFIAENLWVEMEGSTAELVKKHARRGEKILDVGVGMGRLLHHFPELDRYGMDIGLEYLKIAMEKDVRVCHALIEDMPYRKGLFDIVVCTDVLEHVLEFDLCVRNMLSVLKPDGVFVIRVPYKESLKIYAEPSYPYYYSHLRTFDEYSLILQFTRCFGCEVMEWNWVLYLPYTDRFRYRLPTKLGPKMQRGFLKGIGRVWPRKYEYFVKKLFEPAFINMAIRKKTL